MLFAPLKTTCKIWKRNAPKWGLYFADASLQSLLRKLKILTLVFLMRSTSDQYVIRTKYREQVVEIYAREIFPHGVWYGHMRSQLEDYPVFDRGWCFQETLLTSRSLHFGAEEMVFCCRNEVKCECTGFEHQFHPDRRYAGSIYAHFLRNPGRHLISTDCSHFAPRSQTQRSPNNHHLACKD